MDLPYIIQYILWRGREKEQFARIYLSLIEAYHWTPKQISNDVTIAQLLGLWLYKETEIEDGAAVMAALQEKRKKQ
jgi:hypothetical protein